MVPSPPSSEEDDGGVAGADYAAASPPPRRLHNFSFSTLSWGTTRLLRCSKLGLVTSSQEQSPPPPPPPDGDRKAEGGRVVAAAARPWNLRTRRAACVMPEESGRRRNSIPMSSSPSPEKEIRSGRSRPEVLVEKAHKGVRRKFSVSLSKEEIEEDFMATKGSRPPRRPKKRPRMVQRQLDSLFPGLWLSEVSLDTYKTND